MAKFIQVQSPTEHHTDYINIETIKLTQNAQNPDRSSIRFIGADEHPLPISESAAN
jgi:hypothetical protein